MQFAQADAGGVEAVERFHRVLVFHGEVAGVVVHAEMLLELVHVAGPVRHHVGEELERLLRVLDPAKRLGFDAEMQVLAGLGGKLRDMVDREPEVAADLGGLARARDEFLVRARHRADRSIHAVRHDGREDVEEPFRVVQPFLRRPVGLEDLFLHADAVELAVGKSVDRENVAVLRIEPVLEGRQRLGLHQLARRHVAQPQSDGVGTSGRHAVAHGEHILAKCPEDFRPRLAAMDVRAVGEVDAVGQTHGLGLNRTCRRRRRNLYVGRAMDDSPPRPAGRCSSSKNIKGHDETQPQKTLNRQKGNQVLRLVGRWLRPSRRCVCVQPSGSSGIEWKMEHSNLFGFPRQAAAPKTICALEPRISSGSPVRRLQIHLGPQPPIPPVFTNTPLLLPSLVKRVAALITALPSPATLSC